MLQKVVMPALGQTVEEALIEKWHKQEGEAIGKGEILLEITTDKASLEVESFFNGTVLKVLYADGDTVPVNRTIAVLGDPGEEIPDDFLKEEETAPAPVQAQAAPAPRTPAAAPSAPASTAVPAPEVPTDRIFVSPRARRLAEENLICVDHLTGSGPAGRIVEDDVKGYIEKLKGIRISPAARKLAFARKADILKIAGSGKNGEIVRQDIEAAAPAPAELIPLTRIEAITAERMTQSFTTIPQFSLSMDVDMGAAKGFCRIQKESGSAITMTALMVKAVSDALVEYPRMGASYTPGGLNPMAGAHIGIAVGLDSGELIVPVLRDTDKMDLEELGVKCKDLVKRARTKKLLPDELRGGVITISNLGMYGVSQFVPIINPGEASIMGVGAIVDTPVAVDGEITVRPRMAFSVVFDHRVINGAVGAQFMAFFKELLEKAGS